MFSTGSFADGFVKSFILPNNNSYKVAQTVPPPHYMHHVVLRSKDLFICFHSSHCERWSAGKIAHPAAPFLNAAAAAAADWEPSAAAAADNVLASSLAQLQFDPASGPALLSVSAFRIGV